MNVFLFAWSPKKYPWPKIDESIATLNREKEWIDTWRVAVTLLGSSQIPSSLPLTLLYSSFSGQEFSAEGSSRDFKKITIIESVPRDEL